MSVILSALLLISSPINTIDFNKYEFKEIPNITEEIKNTYEKHEEEKEIEIFKRTIFRLETGNGTSYLWIYKNNPGGIKCGVDYCTYSTPDDGMKSLDSLIRLYYRDYGKDYKAATDRYCQCGEEYYPLFMEIYNEEKIKVLRGE